MLVSSFYLPSRYGIPYPQSLGPQFRKGLRRDFIHGISSKRPEFVLLGDSVLYDGVDQDSLSRQLGVQTYTIGEPGFASAAWYLILKNIVMRASYRPRYVVILFRDTQLTAPSERTTGRYFDIMDDFAGVDEPLVAQLAYINQMSPLEKLAEQYLPVYSARWKIREDLDRRIRYAAPSALMNCSKECTDEAMNSIFGVQVDVVALNHAVEVHCFG